MLHEEMSPFIYILHGSVFAWYTVRSQLAPLHTSSWNVMAFLLYSLE